MRILRTCLLLLLCLAVPAYAGMSMGIAAAPCGMHGGTAHEVAAADEAPGCCDEAPAKALSAKPCKPGQECKTAGIVLPPVSAGAAGVAPDTHVAPLDARLPPPGHLAEIWRPPSARA